MNPSVSPTSIALTAIATIHANPDARVIAASAGASAGVGVGARAAARVG